MNTPEKLLKLAEKTARAAGERLLKGIDNYRTIHAEDEKDIKLEADRECEKLIRQLLCTNSPYSIIGEEQGGDASLIKSEELFWVVDPLDGTYNYLRALPMCCVSIALFQGQKPLLGVVFDFYRNELFSALADKHFFIDGKPFQPHWAPCQNKAVLATGFPIARNYSSEALKKFVNAVQRFKKVRMLGSAALALTYVAAGRVDTYHEEGIRLWDIAAGLALVKAAGGFVKIEQLQPNSLPPTLAYNVWASGKEEFLKI
jgi:myo-inositol-1(or 4)-monophosphatase